MIKHRIFSIVTFICMLMCASMSMAQEVYVDVRPKQNPLPAQAALYVENPGRFFNVTLTNLSDEPVPVRLEVRLEGPIESQLDLWPDGGDYLAIVANRPIDYYQYLGAGQPRTITDSELNLMFNRYVNNERYAGGRLSQLFDDVAGGHVGLLPEGHYGLKIIAKTNYIDQNDQGRIIGEGECYFDISYKASAPSFIEPNSSQGSGYIKADFPYQTGRFAWTPPTFSNNRMDGNRNIIYDFRIMRVANGMSPYEAATSGAVAYEQKGLMTTFCNVPYSVISTLRRSGTTRYVAQVTARSMVSDASSNQFVMIDNEGKSEIMDLYLPPFSSSGQDGDIGIPGDGDYPIIATITPKATLLTNNMTPYFETPSDLFTVTLKNTSSKEYEVSMLIQYHRENWGVCPTPALQHSNQSMTIPGGDEITLSDDELDRLAGGYPLESIIAFKAQTGFIIGPPSDYNFQYPNNLATIRVCEYTGQPVLRERIIGKARCEYAVDAAVSVGDDLKAELIAKLPNLPTDAEVYFTNPSRLFKLKITNLGLTTKKFTGVIEYIVDDNVSYSGYDEKNAHTEQYFEIPSGESIDLSDADFDKLFGGFKSIKIIKKGEENSSNQTETNKPFSDAKFVFEDEGTNSANINIFDYEKLLKDRSKPREALLHTHSLNFTISDYVNLGKVGITIEPCLKHMPDWLNPYFEHPGTLFKITLKNYTKETLTLLPHITYTSIEEDGKYQYTPFNSYAEAMSPITLSANDEKPLTPEEINKFFGGLTDRDENNDGIKDVIAYQYKEDTGEERMIGNTDKALSTEELFSAWIRLFDANLYESVPKDDPQRMEKITISENKYSFNPSAESTTDVLTVEVTPKMAQMPINAEAYFTKPHKLWNVTLHNNLDEPLDVILYPIYAFDDQYGISYVIHKKDELQRYAVKLKPFQNWVLTEEEIYKYFAAHDIVYQKREEAGTVLTDEISRLDLEDITVGVNADNMLQLLVLSYDITSKQSSGNINEYVHGSTSATWRGAEETYLNDIEIKVTPKEDPLVDDAALYFKNPGILFNVELKNNTFKDQKLLLTTTYRFHEDGAFYSGDFSNRLDSAIIVPKNEPKILTNNELNKLCGNLDVVNEITPTPGGNQSKRIYSLNSIKLNYTSYNQIEVNAYNVDTLKLISKDDKTRNLRAFVGSDKCDFNIREGQNNLGLKVKIIPKNDVAFKLEPDSYFESPGDYFDITLTNDRAEDVDVKLRLTYNKRFYGEDRDSVITLKGKSELKLSKDRINNILGKYNIYSDKINEIDEKGKHIGTKTGEDVVLKQGTNIVSALMWRAPKKDQIDSKDQKIKIDTICVHDTIFVPAAGKVKIGKYELTIEEIEKVNGSDKEQEKLKYECFKGKGYIKVKPFGAEANLNVEWDSIYINWKDAVVTKGLVRSAKPVNQFFPAELFSEEVKTQLAAADSTLYKTKVDSIITNSNFTEYYRWVQKDMQYLRNMTGDRVTLPVGLSLPLKADGQCPADIQLAQMQFTPEKATIDIIGEFILPETDYLGDVTYDNGVAKYTGDILVFAAQDLETTPEKFLPTSGSVGLLTDITIHDPITGFDFTFVAPKERFAKATSGCYIAWQNGEFDKLSASIKVNVPGGEIIKVVDGVVDENGTPPSIQVDALISDGSDWFGNVSMDNFELADLPGYTFTVSSSKGAGDTGIYYDHSRRITRGAEVKSGESGRVEFHPDYYDKSLGGSGKPASDEKAYNAWQGFYFKEVALELPAYDILNNTDSVPRPKIAINNLMYDDTGFSGSASVKNIIDYQKDGWRFAIDSIAVSILQGDFRDTGFKGKIGFPLLKKAAGLDSVNVDTTDIANPIYPTKFDYAYLTYQAKVIAIDKTEKHKGGTSTTFELGQELDSIYIDCFLAKVKLQDDKTWFWLNHNTTREKKKQTYFDFSLGGDITISAGDMKLPAIPFSGLGYANCTKAEKESAEKGAEAPKTNTTKPESSGTQIHGPDGKRFSLGDWDFNKNDATNDNSFKGFPLYVDSLSFDVKGIDNIGVKFRCGLSLLGNKKAGVAGSVGLSVYAKINWDNLSVKYDRTEVTDVSLDGNFGGVVTISGGLKVCDGDSLSGFETLPGKPLHLGIKGLFDLDIAGGYYKVRKTAEDFAIDSYSEKQDSTYHAGYFLGKASKMNIPIGPVALNMVMGGLFINYSTTAGGVSGTDNSFYDAIQQNAKIKYKTYGGAFGIGLSSVGSDALLKGDLNFMLLMDMSGDEVKVPEFHMQGNIHALCASPDSEDGLINSRVDLIYQNNTNERDPQPDQCKSFTLNLTTTAGGTVDQLYEQFTGEKLEVPEAVGDYLNKFDAKNASEENKGEGNDTSDKSAKSESKGFLKGGCSAEIKMELQIRNYPYAINDKGGKGKTFWHLYIGKPTPENERCRITFIDFEIGKDKPVGLWAKVYANAYLCMGNELPDNGALPPVPDKVLEALGMKGADGKSHPENMAKLQAAREEQLSGFKSKAIDGGIMLGAAMGAEIGCNAVFCYASVEGMMGFDVVLKKLKEGETCGDGKLPGLNGFYVNGQAYAMFKGELGLMLDLWIYKGKVPLVDMTLGALLKAGFPNPTWVYGRVRAAGSVLGGLIKFNSTIELKAGKICIPTFGNPLDDVEIFGDFNPGDEELERGWAEENAVSPYGSVSFTTNMKMGKYLPLVDQRRTAENIGMGDIPEDDEQVEDKSVLRTYVFRLGRVNEKTGKPVSGMPTFELAQFSKGDNDKSPETDPRYIEFKNPSGDKENFTLVTGSLKANKFYRATLAGYCKEIINGKEVNPVFNDSTTNYQDKSVPWYQYKTVYFRTGNLSDNIQKNIAGFTPSATDENYNYYTASLEDVINPTVMMKYDCEDYWNSPDHEFTASVMEYVTKTDERGQTVGEWVYPDAKNGLYRGQKSIFQDLDIRLMTEEGVDENGDEYFYQTVKLAQPLESRYFKKGGRYKFEIVRFNRKLMTDHINLIEQRYEDMMKIVESDKATFEAALEKMNDEEQVVAKQMYDYYMAMEEEYGENTAEQRKTEFVEQAKQNSDMFAETVWSHEYTYNGFSSFQNYIKSSHEKGYAFRNGSKQIGTTSNYFTLPIQYQYYSRNLKDYSYTRFNNPYYAMNFWHSKAFVWYSGDSSDKDGKLDKFKYCDANIMACQGIDYATYEETYTSQYSAPTLKSSLPPFAKYRTISLGLNGYDWAGKRSDSRVSFMLDPINGRNYRATSWHNIREDVYHLGGYLAGVITSIYTNDCDAVEKFEAKLRYLWLIQTNYSHTKDLSGKNLKKFKDENTVAATYNSMTWAAETTASKGLITAPKWQMGLMLGADNGHIKEVKDTRPKGIASYKSLMGERGYSFNENLFLNNFKSMTFKVRYADGYNQRTESYGVRPENQAIRRNKLVVYFDEKGLKGNSTFSISNDGQKIHFSDPEFRRYLIAQCDNNEDGSLSPEELNSLREINVNYSQYRVKSFTGLEHLPNVERVVLNSFNHWSVNFKPTNPYIDLNLLPKLKKVTIIDTDCENVRFDVGKAENLEKIRCSGSKLHGIRFTPNLNLNSFQATDCYFDAEVIKNYKNLTYLDLEKSVGRTISIVGLHKLTYINVKDFKYENHKFVTLIADNIPDYKSYFKSNEFKVLNSYTGKAADCKVKVEWISVNPSQLDENLRKAIEEKIGGTFVGSSSAPRKLTTLDVSGRKIKSLKYLEAFCPLLKSLKVDDNKLSELDLSGFNDLTEVSASNNVISYVDVAEGNVITELNVSNNQIPALPTQKLSKLKTLNCANNYIEELYGNHLKEIRYLDCSNNMLTELILDQTYVKEVDCSNNKLSVLKLPNSTDMLERFSANNCFGGDVNFKLDFRKYSKLRELNLADNAGLTELKIPTHERFESVVARNCNLQGTFAFSPGLRTTEAYPLIETIDMSNNPNLKVIVNSPYFGYNYLKEMNFTGCDIISVVIGGVPYYASGLQVRVGVPQRESGRKVKIQFTDGGVDWFERWEEWRKYPENQHTVVAFTMVDGVAKYYDSQSLTLENISSQDKDMRKDFGEKLYASLLKEKNKGKALEEQSRVFKVSDANALTELNAANMNIKHLTRVLRWMPNLTTIDASGNEISTINLQNQKIDNKAVYPLKNVTSLNLSNNSELNTLLMQSISMLELSNSNLNTTTFNHVLQRVTNKLTINNPGGTVKAYALDGNSNAKIKELHYGNTSKPLNVSACNLSTLSIVNAPFKVADIGASASNISINNFRAKGQDTKISIVAPGYGSNMIPDAVYKTPIANTSTFEDVELTGALLRKWIKLTSNSMFVKNCTAVGDLNVESTGVKKLTLEEMKTNITLSLCDLDLLTLDNSVITLGGQNTSRIVIDEIKVKGNSTIYFQTADMMIMWVTKWKYQNPDQDVNLRVSAMTPEKESLASLANAYISSGQIDFNKMLPSEMLKALTYLVEKGYIPKGNTYDKLLKKLEDEALNEKLTDEERTMKSDFGDKLYASLLEIKNKDREIKSDILHVEDVASLTSLNAGYMGITNLARVLRWMPNLTVVHAQGNAMSTVNLQNQMMDGKAIYPMKNVKNLNLSYNKSLTTLNLQTVDSLALVVTSLSATAFKNATEKTSKRLYINSPVIPSQGTQYKLTTVDKPLKTLIYVNTSKDLMVSSCNLDMLQVHDAPVTLMGNYTTNIKIKKLLVNNNTTISFQTADMLLMWLCGWQKQNPQFTVTCKISGMTDSAATNAARATTYLQSLNLKSMTQSQLITLVEKLVSDYNLPKGNRYSSVISLLKGGQKIVEY